MSYQLDIEPLKELCAEATPGPWTVTDDTCRKCIEEGVNEYNIYEVPGGRHAQFSQKVDAEFIAAARTALPDLIAANERLEAELVEARQRIQKLEAQDRESHDLCCRLASKIGIERGHSEKMTRERDQAREQRDTLAKALTEIRVHLVCEKLPGAHRTDMPLKLAESALAALPKEQDAAKENAKHE